MGRWTNLRSCYGSTCGGGGGAQDIAGSSGGLIGPRCRLRLRRAFRSCGGRGLTSRIFVRRDEKIRDHAALLQVGAESLRVISIREDPSADAIKYAFPGDVALDYVCGDVLGPELSDFLFGLRSGRRGLELHRISRVLRARRPEQHQNKR